MEMNGLRALISDGVTPHSLASPPERESFNNNAEYDRAYDEWYVRMNYWRVTIKE